MALSNFDYLSATDLREIASIVNGVLRYNSVLTLFFKDEHEEKEAIDLIEPLIYAQGLHPVVLIGVKKNAAIMPGNDKIACFYVSEDNILAAMDHISRHPTLEMCILLRLNSSLLIQTAVLSYAKQSNIPLITTTVSPVCPDIGFCF